MTIKAGWNKIANRTPRRQNKQKERWREEDYTCKTARQSKKDLATSIPRNIFVITSLSKRHVSSPTFNDKALLQRQRTYNVQDIKMGGTWYRITLVLLDREFSGDRRPKKSCMRKTPGRVELNTSCQGGHRSFFPFCESYLEHLFEFEGSALLAWKQYVEFILSNKNIALFSNEKSREERML